MIQTYSMVFWKRPFETDINEMTEISVPLTGSEQIQIRIMRSCEYDPNIQHDFLETSI